MASRWYNCLDDLVTTTNIADRKKNETCNRIRINSKTSRIVFKQPFVNFIGFKFYNRIKMQRGCYKSKFAYVLIIPSSNPYLIVLKQKNWINDFLILI